MINYAYSQRRQYNSTPYQTFLCFVVFCDLTAFFFLSFMNICFDTLVSDPPIWLLVILFTIMALDICAQMYYNKKLTIRFMLYVAIQVFLILSWAIKVNWILYLSSTVFLRFPQIIKFNQIMQSKLRKYHLIFKLYTFFKIFYTIAVVGHVLGCIFYAIDNTLIKQEYYGPLAENPLLYYQGQLLCYTPIYSLDQINRYVYCMYYIFSLLATVAYGDIIPKNPFQNAYVCILLVLSTVSISFIIEQLLIVLADHRDQTYAILKKIKYLDSMLQKSTTFSTLSRLKLVGYMLHSMKHDMKNNPHINLLSPSLQRMLIGQSIGLKKISHTSDTLQGVNKITNLRIYEEYSLPSFLAEFLLTHLQQKYYPARYLLVNNEDSFQPCNMFLTLKGQLKLGYGEAYLMRKIVKNKNKLLSWRQFIWNNKSLHRHFQIQTKGLSQLYVISGQTIQQLIANQRYKSIHEDKYSQILEKYHIARDNQLLQIYYQNEELFYSSQSMNLILQEQLQKQEKIYQVSNHILRCWSCGKRTHMPINCPNIHYKSDIWDIMKHFHYTQERNKKYKRTERKCQKVKFIKHQNKNIQEIKAKIFMKSFLNRKNQQFKLLKTLYDGSKPSVFEQYQDFEHFYHNFNFSTNNCEKS